LVSRPVKKWGSWRAMVFCPVFCRRIVVFHDNFEVQSDENPRCHVL
jgi:hypothetical protein